MRKVILATHGELANGMLNSVSMIVGDLAKDVDVFCLHPGQNPNDYMNELKEEIYRQQHIEYVFLCDIKGGSVHTALSQLCVYPNVKVFSGMNMNLVLDILLSCPEDIDETNEASIIRNAKEGITLTTRKHLVIEEDDDF